MKAVKMCIATCCAAVLVPNSLAASVAAAVVQPYPTKPIRILVTTTPGSGGDILVRLIGSKLTQAWGQQVVVDNRAGASGILGTEIAARAAPDGYTLMLATSQHATVTAMYEKLNYDLIKDFSPISLLHKPPFILVVHPSVMATSVRELIALAKARPGTLHYGSGGWGSPTHLSAEVFKSMTGADLVHVPYKGSAVALADTMAGHVQLSFPTVAAVLPLIKAGKVRALGVTSLERTFFAPDLPTISESVPGFEFIGWSGLVAPARTPGKIISKLNGELVRLLRTGDFRERVSELGSEPLGTTPQEFALHIKAEVEKMRKALKVAGVRPDV